MIYQEFIYEKYNEQLQISSNINQNKFSSLISFPQLSSPLIPSYHFIQLHIPLYIFLSFFIIYISMYIILFILLLQIIHSRLLQFSRFVPGTIVNLPTLRDYGFGQFKNPFDNYIPTHIAGGFGGTREVIQTVCSRPLIFVNGGCQCPPPARQIGGHCFGVPEDFVYPQQRREDEITFPRQSITENINPNSISGLAAISRNHNGTGNNLNQPFWGSAGQILERRSPANYQDGRSQPRRNLSNPRRVSNLLGAIRGQTQRNRNNVSSSFVIFGQFLDHDIDLTHIGTRQKMDINVPPADNFFTQSTIQFFRSQYQETNQFRQHRNVITAWIDGSQVYGSDEPVSRLLRTFSEGKMRTSKDNLLPLQGGFFLAGDQRANENIMLTSYHTLFVREHNRICDELKNQQPFLNDEELYQAARHYVIGLLQKIVFEEFLPILLGKRGFQKHIGAYTGYKPYLNPNIATEFSTAAFRVGHSLLLNQYPAVNKNGYIYHRHRLGELFFRPNIVSSTLISDMLRGLQYNVIKERSVKVIDEVRNLLVLNPDNRNIKLDLFSLNLQRSRDHGLSGYNQVRRSYGLRMVRSFEEMVAVNDIETIINLRNTYFGPEDLDLWVGILAEKPEDGGIMGELGAKIIGETFANLRDGDRFWYEHAYPQEVISQIKATKLSDIVRRNTDAKQISDDFFFFKTS